MQLLIRPQVFWFLLLDFDLTTVLHDTKATNRQSRVLANPFCSYFDVVNIEKAVPLPAVIIRTSYHLSCFMS